jgi:acyl-CoA thioesterase FadM
MTDPEMVETYRGAVAAWECDAFGHMNIALYPQRFEAAARDLLERDHAGTAWRTVALDMQYLEELRAAEGTVIMSGVLERDRNRVKLAHEAVTPAGVRTTRAEHVLVCEGTPSSGAFHATVAGWERFSPSEMPKGDGAIVSGRGRVRTAECEDGTLSAGGCTHCFSDANVFVMEAVGMGSAYRRAENRGFATFETRLSIGPGRAAPDLRFVVTSGIIAVGTSSLRMLHRMRAARDGQLLAQFYQAGVHFDLAARRSTPWPPDLRANAEKLIFAAL